MTTTSRPQMTTPERIVFAAGDIFGGGGAALISVLYLFYLTDVIGIPPGYAGLALLIPKIWDAINDPLMGALSDNARTRWGRRRPFIAVGGSLLAFAMAAIWAPIGGWESTTAKTLWAIGAQMAAMAKASRPPPIAMNGRRRPQRVRALSDSAPISGSLMASQILGISSAKPA